MSGAASRPDRRGWPAATRRLALPFIVLAALPTTAWSAPKTDVVELANGDRITCEIKNLEHNQLKVSTYHMGTVYIEWDKVARVTTTQNLLLERADGTRSYGQLVQAVEAGELLVDKGNGSHAERLDMSAVVRATPIEGGEFIDRLDGYVSAGLDFAKASDQRNFDFSGGLSSRTRIREWSLDASANVTDDSAGETSERYDLQAVWRRFLRDRNFYQGFAGLSRNTELDLSLRTLAGGAFGRYFVQSNRAEWAGGVGLAYSHENYSGGEAFDSVEAVLVTEFSVFRYDFPVLDIGGKLTLLPSLTQSGRYRAEAGLRAKYEFVDDLYFELELYGSYDSQPPGTDVEASDYGVVTSLGYSF